MRYVGSNMLDNVETKMPVICSNSDGALIADDPALWRAWENMARRYLFLAFRISLLVGVPLAIITAYGLWRLDPNIKRYPLIASLSAPCIGPLLVLQGLVKTIPIKQLKLDQEKIYYKQLKIPSSVKWRAIKYAKMTRDKDFGLITVSLSMTMGRRRAFVLSPAQAKAFVAFARQKIECKFNNDIF